MEREKMDELYGIAVNMEKDKTSTLYEFARLVEQETLERAALICDEMKEHWSTYKDAALLNGDMALSNAASGEPRAAEALANLIRNLKDNHDKELADGDGAGSGSAVQ